MKKKFLAFSLIFAFILSCPAFIAGLIQEKAMAEGETDIIAMEGAAIRTKTPYGLRFEAKISETDVNSAQSLGMYLCPTDLLPNGEFPVDLSGSLVVGDKPDSTHFIKKVEIPKDTLVDSENPDVKIARLTLIEIKECNFDRKFSAMAYVIKPDTPGTEVRSKPITRSVSYVARKALADPASGLSEAGKDREFVDNIVANSNDFFINTSGVTLDYETANTYKGSFSHRVTLASGQLKNIELCLDERFKNDAVCMIKLFAKKAVEEYVQFGYNSIFRPIQIGTDFTEITLTNFQIADGKVMLQIAGSGDLWLDDIRAMNLTPLGTEGISAMGGATVTKLDSGAVEYNAGNLNKEDNAGFTLGKAVTDDEYLVMKFRYKSDMNNQYFEADAYETEGLHISGQGNASTGCRHEFAIFDENYLDYTLYARTEGNTSYEGDNLADPCGSLHGTKEVSTEAGTWYYAVAPATGNYTSISSPNKYLHIEIADIYSVREEVKNKLFVAQNYPVGLVVPSYPELYIGDVKDAAADVVALSLLGMKAEKLQWSSTDQNCATVTDKGVITAQTPGECEIKVEYYGEGLGESYTKNISVTVCRYKEIPLENLHVIGTEGSCGEITADYTYDSGNHSGLESLIAFGDIPADRYIVIHFRYIGQTGGDGQPINNDFLLYKGTGQTLSEHRTGAPSGEYDHAIIRTGSTLWGGEDMTEYYDDNSGNAPIGCKQLTSGNEYYLFAPNLGSYKGLTSSQPLKCQILEVRAYTLNELAC